MPLNEALAVDREAEAVGIDIRRAHAREDDDGLAGRDRVGVERDGPFAMRRLDLVALPESAVDELASISVAQLAPDFLPARPEPPAQHSHTLTSPSPAPILRATRP